MATGLPDYNGDITTVSTLKVIGLLTEYNGITLQGSGMPSIVVAADLLAQTAAINQQLYLPAAQGMYRISYVAQVHSPTGTSTLTVQVSWTEFGVGTIQTAILSFSATAATLATSAVVCVFPDAATAVSHATTWTSGGAGDNYNLSVRVEAI